MRDMCILKYVNIISFIVIMCTVYDQNCGVINIAMDRVVMQFKGPCCQNT